MTTNRLRLVVAIAASAPLVAPLAVHAQLTNSSAAATAMGNSGTATARGYDAIYWNPAGLAMPGTGKWSLALMPFTLGVGAGPVSLSDFSNVGGTVMSDATKNAWLSRVTGTDRQKVNTSGEVTLLAANLGRIGVQVSATGGGSGVLTRDAMELLLYGNAGRTGTAGSYSLKGSSVTGGALATVGVSYAQPLHVRLGSAKRQASAVGLTVHYTKGLGLVRAQDNGTVIDNQPLDVRLAFPAVSPGSGGLGSSGSGVGVDVGAAWQGGAWRGGVAVRNALNTFAWDGAALSYRAASAHYASGARTSNFDEQPFDMAPAALKQWVSDARIQPSVAFGLAWQRSSKLLVNFDAHQQLGDGMPWGIKRSVGGGVEVRPVSWLPLRGGVAMLDRGAQFGGGAGIETHVIRLQWALASRTDSQFGPQTMNSVTVAVGAFGR